MALRRWMTGALAAMAAICVTGHVQAQPYNWGGLYFGGHIGGAWSDTDWSWDLPGLAANQPVTNSTSGIAGGVHVGLQHQWGNVVAGVELSVTSTDLRDRETINFVSGFDRHFDSRINSLLMANVRFGFAMDRWLAYVKGGLASGQVELRTVRAFDGLFQTTSREREVGWNIGGGLEYAFNPSMILGVEYTYVDLGGSDRLNVNLPTTIQYTTWASTPRCTL